MAPPGPRPAVLMAALGLLVLTPPRTALVVTSPRGPAPAEAPPFRNLRVDPALRRLAWDRERPGPRAACRKEGRGPQWSPVSHLSPVNHIRVSCQSSVTCPSPRRHLSIIVSRLSITHPVSIICDLSIIVRPSPDNLVWVTCPSSPRRLSIIFESPVRHPPATCQSSVSCQSPVRVSPVRHPADAGAERCTFPSLSLCHPTDLTVFLRGVPGSAASVRFPDPDSTPPPPARGLRCSVHDVVRLTCRWDPGPGAGPEPHFRMHFRPASANRSADRECPRYLGPGDGDVTLVGGRGPRLGCRVDDVTALPPLLTVTVTAAGAPGCSDAAVDLPSAEALAPPTLAAACNGSREALLRWEVRSLFHADFDFELQINKSSRSEPEVVTTSERQHRVRNPGSASFRVRARAEDDAVNVSDWSAAAMLDCRPRPRGAVTALTGGLAGLGAGLALLTSLLLLWRRPLGRSLCPRIPRLKDPMGAEPGETVPWPAAPEDCQVTHVTEA